MFQARETSQEVPFMATMACQSFYGMGGTIVVTRSSGSDEEVVTTTYREFDVLNAYGVVIASATETSTTAAPTSATSTTPTSETGPASRVSSNQFLL